MTPRLTVYALALLFGLCAALVSYFAPFIPYGVDSASYIEQARSFMARGVFEVTFFGLDHSNEVSTPDRLFPPGFPLLMALLSYLLQLRVEIVAPYLSLVALILLPVIIVYAFQRAVGLTSALAIAVLVVLTPVAVRHGFIAYSDTLSLALVVFCVGRLLTADNTARSWFYLGLLTGLAYVLRNANLGLLLSIGLYGVWQFIVEPTQRRALVTNGLVWLGANGLLILPLLAHNYQVFGKLQPYWMPPSSLSVRENSHDYLKAQLDTLLSVSDLDKWLSSSIWGVVLLLCALVALFYPALKNWRNWRKIEQQTFFIAAVYAAIGAAMVIVARSKYEWGIHIDARYALPYSCFIFVATVCAFNNTAYRHNFRYWGLGLAALLLAARVYALPQLYDYSNYHQSVMRVANHLQTQPDSICQNKQPRFVMSNFAFVYRILCPYAPVRHVYPPFQQAKLLQDAIPNWTAMTAHQAIAVSMFPYQNDRRSDLPLTPEHVSKLQSQGWVVEINDPDHLLLSHPARNAL